MSIWYPSSGLTWSQYLQAESFVRDVRGSIDTSRSTMRSAISSQTRSLVASNEQLANRFGRAFDQMSGRLEMGLRAIEQGIGSVADAIEAFHADFTYSFNLLVEQMRIQNGLLVALVDKLDAIHNTLKSPTATKAREFYQIGCERMARGLLDKAMESLQRSAELNDTDFFTQFQIGKLYVYGIDDDDNVVDLAKGKAHLLEAARYGKAEASADPSFLRLAAQACLHASIAVYASIDDGGQNQRGADLLKEADSLASRALQYDLELGEAFYHRAKYSALLKDPSTTTLLRSAVQLDRDYAVKGDLDPAFEGCRPQVAQLLERLRDDVRSQAEEQVRRTRSTRQEALNWELNSQQLASLLADAEQHWATAQSNARYGTYFGFLDSITAARRAADQFGELAATRRTEEEQALSVAHNKVNVTLERAGRITANAERFDRAKQLLQRSRVEANANTFGAYQQAKALTGAAQSNADGALSDTQTFNAEESRRRQKRRRFEEATAEIPRLFIMLPLIWGIVSFVVLGMGACGFHGGNIIEHREYADFTFDRFLIGAGIALFFGIVSFCKKL